MMNATVVRGIGKWSLLVVCFALTLVGCKKKAFDGYEVIGFVTAQNATADTLVVKTEDNNTYRVATHSVTQPMAEFGLGDILRIQFHESDSNLLKAENVIVEERWVEGTVVELAENALVLVSNVDSFMFDISEAQIIGSEELLYQYVRIYYATITPDDKESNSLRATRIIINE